MGKVVGVWQRHPGKEEEAWGDRSCRGLAGATGVWPELAAGVVNGRGAETVTASCKTPMRASIKRRDGEGERAVGVSRRDVGVDEYVTF
jgi:hypothetical protein